MFSGLRELTPSSVSLSLFDIIKSAVIPTAAPVPIIAASLPEVSLNGPSPVLCENEKLRKKRNDREKKEMVL